MFTRGKQLECDTIEKLELSNQNVKGSQTKTLLVSFRNEFKRRSKGMTEK